MAEFLSCAALDRQQKNIKTMFRTNGSVEAGIWRPEVTTRMLKTFTNL